MPSAILHDQAKKYSRPFPEIEPGFTVRVHERIKEGEKERTQIFEGLVISVHRGHTNADATFTVRRIASGVGVEKIFPFCSPMVEKVEVKKVAKVRRAKLSFLRGRLGKSARMSERFTTSDEFAVAVAAPEEVKEAGVTEAQIAVAEAPAEPASEAPSEEAAK
jgi:large subunit ribosomal protein L19